jgi:hypothetical protein
VRRFLIWWAKRTQGKGVCNCGENTQALCWLERCPNYADLRGTSAKGWWE